MKTHKLVLTVIVMASLITIPCTASFARDAVSSSDPSSTATVHVVKKDDTGKERGFFEKIFDSIGSAFNNVVNYFTGERTAEKQADQRKATEQLQQPTEQLATASVVTPAPLEIVGEQSVRQTAPSATEPTVPQEVLKDVQPQVQEQQQVLQPAAQAPSVTTRTTQSTSPVITVPQSPAKNDILGLSKIEVEKNVPEIADDREPSEAAAGEAPKQPMTLSAPAATPSAPPPAAREPAAPAASEIREPSARIEATEAPKTVAIIQTPIPATRTASDRETTTTDRRTATATRETQTTATGTRSTATIQPAQPATRDIPQITETIIETPRETTAATEPEARPTGHTETFDGQTIIGMTLAPVDRFVIVDTVNKDTANTRTFVVSLDGAGRTECPAAQQTATTTRDTTTQTVTESTRTGVRETSPTGAQTLAAPSSPATGNTILQRSAAKTLAAPGTIEGASAGVQRTPVITDELKAEMQAQCPEVTQRLPVSDTESEIGARFVVRTETRMAYVMDNSLRTLSTLKTIEIEDQPAADSAAQQAAPSGESVQAAAGIQETAIAPILDVIPEAGDCKATLKATVLCAATTDCTKDFEINTSFKVGNTEMNDFVVRNDPSSFSILPPTKPAEPAKGLSLSLNKAEIAGPVTITVTAKKGDLLLEHVVDDLSNKDDLAGKCVTPAAQLVDGGGSATDTSGVVGSNLAETGSSEIGGGGGCSLIRR